VRPGLHHPHHPSKTPASCVPLRNVVVLVCSLQDQKHIQRYGNLSATPETTRARNQLASRGSRRQTVASFVLHPYNRALYTARFLPSNGSCAVWAAPCCIRYVTSSSYSTTGACSPALFVYLLPGNWFTNTQHGTMQNGLRHLFASSMIGSVAASGCSPTNREHAWALCKQPSTLETRRCHMPDSMPHLHVLRTYLHVFSTSRLCQHLLNLRYAEIVHVNLGSLEHVSVPAAEFPCGPWPGFHQRACDTMNMYQLKRQLSSPARHVQNTCVPLRIIFVPVCCLSGIIIVLVCSLQDKKHTCAAVQHVLAVGPHQPLRQHGCAQAFLASIKRMWISRGVANQPPSLVSRFEPFRASSW
jgi:hypothetical protein